MHMIRWMRTAFYTVRKKIDLRKLQHVSLVITVKHVLFVSIKFLQISRAGQNHKIKYPQKFSLLIKDLEYVGNIMLGKHQFIMQPNFYIPKSQN